MATLTELRRKTSDIVRPVIHAGKTVILTEHGKPVAEIVPLADAEPDLGRAFEIIRSIGPVKLEPRK